MEFPAYRIKLLRESKQFSQLEIELIADISTGTISRIETGKVNPTKETLKKIADAMKLTVQERVYLFCIV
jgi:transcriptional regulator with XRE-family HTH domain